MADSITIASQRKADAIFSGDGSAVYVSDGTAIAIHDSATGRTTETLTVGATLGAIAASPDGRFLVAAGATATNGAAAIYRIDLTNGAVTSYSLALPNGGAFFDVAVDANGRVLASGANRLYALNLATDTFAAFPQKFSASPRLEPSADGRTILVDSDSYADVPLAVYRAGKGIVAEHHDPYDPYAGASITVHDGAVSAITRDGSWIFDAYKLTVYDAQLQPVVNLATRFPYLGAAGAAFSPDATHLYLFGYHSVVVVDTATWDVTGMFAVGVDYVGPRDLYDAQLASQFGNAFEVAPDGHTLKVVGSTGVTLVDLDTLASSGSTAGADHLEASDYAALLGFGGDDVLTLNAGGEMYGGEGDDTYVVNAEMTTVWEYAGQGTDTVRAAVGFELGANVENLVLLGGADYGRGNASDNVITAGDTAALLYGLEGNDTLIGGRGGDLLDGGAGDNRLEGGTGEDTYRVFTPGDQVVEGAGGGIDTVESFISYTLGDNVEQLQLEGKALTGTGNALANEIGGNELANVLDGGDGNDRLLGNSGNDVLRGGRGLDTLEGGYGDDDYEVDRPGDPIVELSDYGHDTVHASVGFKLSANVEDLVLVGDRAINGTGNSLANTIIGDAAANRLTGLGGADWLDGGGGDDVLIGGAGDDVLVGDTGSDALTGGGGADRFRILPGDDRAAPDRITDFHQDQHDRIDLTAIDARSATPGMDVFTYIGATRFSGVAGELRIVLTSDSTLVLGDTDGDGRGDFALALDGRIVLTATDFASDALATAAWWEHDCHAAPLAAESAAFG